MVRRINLTGLFLAMTASFAVAQNVQGSGTPGTVPVFTGSGTTSNTIGTPSSPITVDPNTGNVGIGTTQPGEKLEIGSSGNLRVTGDQFGINVETYGNWPYNNWLYRTLWNPTYGDMVYFAPSGNHPATQDAAMVLNGNVLFGTGKTTGDGLTTEWMRVNWNGNVGIGTTSPGSNHKLEVNGNIALTGGSGASVTFQDGTQQSTAWTGVLCGGDYAESVNVSGDRKDFEPGDVLVVDPDHDGKFIKSPEPYSTTVMGVYSSKPGALGRRQTTPKSEDEVPLAMIGIVPTKVSAENGAIKPGDLLVTSSLPGYAMKGMDRSRMLGAVIGKALGHLDSGQGVIEVGVTLQ